MSRPRWLICEDGTEYLDRFQRFLGGEFQFLHAEDGAALLAALRGDGDPVRGVILDLDFRRTPPERLLQEEGEDGAGPLLALPESARRRLAAEQGIHILRHLRAKGHRVPVILFADFDDPGQGAFLEEALPPLSIAPGHEGILATAARMRAL